MKHKNLDPYERRALAKQTASTAVDPGSISVAANIPYEQAYSIWWGALHEEARREWNDGKDTDE